jgi:ATP-dependent helicase HrpB
MLPIHSVLPQLRAALRDHTEAVLQAPAGAGKTTIVPQALLGEAWLDGRRIVMLEPRRLAARAAARRMAALLGERIGQTVGYRVRMDTRVGPATRIEVVTEGVLTRFLQEDPSLEGIGLVIFDEFHERSLQADLGLALTLESRRIFRNELRVLVMSATLQTAGVADLLDHAPVISSEGRNYPVEMHYLDHVPEGRIEGVAARMVRRALHEHDEGDVLVFLPGAAEIRRTMSGLEDLPEHVSVQALFGNLPQREQDRAMEPAGQGRRKVVLATDIAETSLTIEGVRIVVDAGLMRVPRFSPRSGMTGLATIRVSGASADQRRGRAGRLGPGVCYRLWTKIEQHHLEPHGAPEIAHADLAPLALELARWGSPDPSCLRWMDPPPGAAYEQARDLLRQLRAVDADGSITQYGRRMSTLGLHPRLAHMLLEAEKLGAGGLACDLAALLSERDIFRTGGGFENADLRLRLQALHDLRESKGPNSEVARGFHVDRGAARHALRVSAHWRRRTKVREHASEIDLCGLLLSFAYPDRIAQRIDGRFRLRNGRIAGLHGLQPLSRADFLVAADLGDRRRESRIFRAAPLEPEDLLTRFADQLVQESRIYWEEGVVRARRRVTLDALVLKDSPLPDPDPGRMAAAMVDGIRAETLDVLPWTKKARSLQKRLIFLAVQGGDWPKATDEALLAQLEDWLLPHLYGMKRAEDLQRLDLAELLLGLAGWDRREEIEERAPTHVTVPSGSRIPIDYSDPHGPVLAVRLQELFGSTETPRIDRGRVPLTLHLLSPAHRPAQVTQDLAGFWRETYFDVRKDLRGRYPKHYWPEDPLRAAPTNRTKRN